MGWNDHIDPDDYDLPEVLHVLIYQHDALRGAQLGVAKQVIDRGLGSLTPKQEAVIESIKRQHLQVTCMRCHDTIPMSELVIGLDTGLCSWCDHMMNKDD